MIKSASNDQIILVLQYYENDVDRTISAFLEGNTSSYTIRYDAWLVYCPAYNENGTARHYNVNK